MLKFQEARDFLASDDVDEVEHKPVKEETDILVKEEVKAIEEFVDGDTGKSEPVLVQSAVDMSSTGSNDDMVLTVHKKDKKRKLRKRRRAEADKGTVKTRRINFDLAHNTTRGKVSVIVQSSTSMPK